MPSFTTLFAVLSAASSVVIAAPISIVERATPANWATGYLEPYQTYHLRYLALDCQDQHNTTFFDQCCHPLLATEDLSSRPARCTPSASEVSSASAFVQTATSTDAAATSEYCEEATSVVGEISSAAASISATATAPVSVVTVASTYDVSGSTTIAQATVSVAANLVNGPTSTSTTPAWTPTTSSTAPAATSSASSSNSGSNSGEATYFYQNGNAGACGNYNSDSAYIVAIDSAWWPNYESGGSDLCGTSLTITNTNNGKSAVATVADVCPTCASAGSLDMSTGLFSDLAGSNWESMGTFPISWSFN